MAGDAGQQVDTGRGVDVEIQFSGAQGERIRGGQGKRRLSQFKGINAQEQVVHHRVTDKNRIHDQILVNLGLGSDLGEQGIHALTHRAGHLLIAALVHHRIGNPAHQILTKADLWVHNTGRGDDFAADQIAQMRGNGGGAQINRQPVEGAFVIAWPDMHDLGRVALVAQMHRHGDLPFAFAQGRLQALQDVQVGFDILELPLAVERFDQPLHIARGLVHVGFFHLDIKQPGRGVHGDIAGFGAFAHHLPVHLAFGRDVNHHIPLNLSLTAQSAAINQAALILVALFNLVPLGQGIIGHRHPVFGELAIGGGDLAFRADATPAADRIEIYAQLPCGRQNGRPNREMTALARWRKDDERIAAHKGTPWIHVFPPDHRDLAA